MDVLEIVKSKTVVGWHRAGFRLYWRWKSGPRGGRPRITEGIRALIRQMAEENAGWGALAVAIAAVAVRALDSQLFKILNGFAFFPSSRVFTNHEVVRRMQNPQRSTVRRRESGIESG
jgi:hypothetical protein